MRKNLQEVFNAWTDGRQSNKQNSIWTDGDTIFSYGTALVTHGDYSGEVILNRTKYTRTTSSQQGSLGFLLKQYGFEVLEIDGLPMGTRSSTLFSKAQELHP
jgi:hypothetical protein